MVLLAAVISLAGHSSPSISAFCSPGVNGILTYFRRFTQPNSLLVASLKSLHTHFSTEVGLFHKGKEISKSIFL